MRIQSVFGLVNSVEMNSENVANNCLFCAVPPDHPKASNFIKIEDATTEKQIKALFLLKTMLGIREDKLCQFLPKFDWVDDHEIWIKICDSCGEAVKSCFEIFEEISKLEKKLSEVTKELRGRIWDSRDKQGVGEEEGHKSAWTQVREDVLKEISIKLLTSPEEDDDDEIEAAIGDDKRDKEAETEEKEPESTQVVAMNVPENVSGNFGVASLESNDDDIVSEDVDASTTYQAEEIDVEEEVKEEMKSISNEIFINGEIFIDEEEEDDDDFPDMDDTTRLLQNADIPEEGSMQRLQDSSLPSTSRSSTTVEILTYSITRDGDRTYYQCSHCCFQSLDVKIITSHLELHQSSSAAIICPTCGCFLKPGMLRFHNENIHPRSNPIRSEKPTIYYKCKDCGALSKGFGRSKMHQRLHLEGGGKICRECGWYCSNLTYHRASWHSK